AEALRVVERIPGEAREASVPHERGEEGDVQRERRAGLVARAGAVRPDDPGALEADRGRLGVPEGGRRRRGAAGGGVAAQRPAGSEPEQRAEVCEPAIDGAAESLLERRGDPSSEARRRERGAQLRVEVGGAAPPMRRPQRADDGDAEDDEGEPAEWAHESG